MYDTIQLYIGSGLVLAPVVKWCYLLVLKEGSSSRYRGRYFGEYCTTATGAININIGVLSSLRQWHSFDAYGTGPQRQSDALEEDMQQPYAVVLPVTC